MFILTIPPSILQVTSRERGPSFRLFRLSMAGCEATSLLISSLISNESRELVSPRQDLAKTTGLTRCPVCLQTRRVTLNIAHVLDMSTCASIALPVSELGVRYCVWSRLLPTPTSCLPHTHSYLLKDWNNDVPVYQHTRIFCPCYIFQCIFLYYAWKIHFL